MFVCVCNTKLSNWAHLLADHMRRCFLKPVAKQNVVYRKQRHRGYRCVSIAQCIIDVFTCTYLHVVCFCVLTGTCANVTVRYFLEVYKLREDTLSR